jgi:UDP-2-acetamido-2-deoxy-ribo-hexuluronate aminotransferase
MIKQFNLDRLWSEIREESLASFDTANTSGAVQKPVALESKLCDITGRKHAIATHSCTDAMTIILRSLYPAGSEIIVPCYSFIATATPILLAGLKPVFVDVNNFYHLNLDEVIVTPNTRAMILVSLFGMAPDYDKYQMFCDVNGIDLIEDAAQSWGSRDGQLSGTAGIASALSFSPTKPCPVFGSGGAILTDNSELAERMRLGRLHGKTTNSDATYDVGINSVMSSSDAAQLLVCLKHMDRWQARRTQIAEYYDDRLADTFELPPRQGKHNWHKYVVRTHGADNIIENARAKGIQLAKHYNRLVSDEPVFNCDTEFNNANRLRRASVSLPICPTLTDTEVESVVDALVLSF